MNYKKLPHAPENAQNFDGENWCPEEVGARESQESLKLEESRVYELCCLQVHFVCPGLAGAKHLLADSDSFVCPQTPKLHSN